MKLVNFIKSLFSLSKKISSSHRVIEIEKNQGAMIFREEGAEFILPIDYPDNIDNVEESILLTMEFFLYASYRDDWKRDFALRREEGLDTYEHCREDVLTEDISTKLRNNFEIIEGGITDEE